MSGVDRKASAISAAMLEELAALAAASPRGRQHHNLHSSFAEPCQRFFNALCRDTYIPPHRHSGPNDEETLLAVRGAFFAILFNDDGHIVEVHACGEGQPYIGSIMPIGQWHTVVPLTDAVLLEIKAGPFDPSRAKEIAPWAPQESAEDAPGYRDVLRASCTAWCAQS